MVSKSVYWERNPKSQNLYFCEDLDEDGLHLCSMIGSTYSGFRIVGKYLPTGYEKMVELPHPIFEEVRSELFRLYSSIKEDVVDRLSGERKDNSAQLCPQSGGIQDGTCYVAVIPSKKSGRDPLYRIGRADGINNTGGMKSIHGPVITLDNGSVDFSENIYTFLPESDLVFEIPEEDYKGFYDSWGDIPYRFWNYIENMCSIQGVLHVRL